MGDLQNTRETAYVEGAIEKNTRPRFKIGDVLLTPAFGQIREQIPHAVFWDKEFGGWLVACGTIGVHEQCYILASERDEWEPHDENLWSYWTRKPPAARAGEKQEGKP